MEIMPNISYLVLLIIIGLLVVRFPNLISGVNTLSEKEKARIDIKGLSHSTRNGMMTMGILMIVSVPFLDILGLKHYVGGAMLTIIFVGVAYLLVSSNRFMKKAELSKETKWLKKFVRIILSVATMLAITLIVYGSVQPKIILENKIVSTSGMMGITFVLEDMVLIDSISAIGRKTYGFDFGEVRKGDFKLKNKKKATLFLQSLTGPYIILQTIKERR